MSIKINLEFQTKIDLEFLTNGINLRLIRLLGNVHLKSHQNWSTEEKVIIDTGNPISIIPFSIWQNVERNILISSKTKLYGLSSTVEAALSGQLAEVTIVFKDEKNIVFNKYEIVFSYIFSYILTAFLTLAFLPISGNTRTFFILSAFLILGLVSTAKHKKLTQRKGRPSLKT